MTHLTLDLDDALLRRLGARAAAHGRSIPEEGREALRAALARGEPAEAEGLVALARRLFGPAHGADLVLPPRGAAPERPPPDFTDAADDPAGGR